MFFFSAGRDRVDFCFILLTSLSLRENKKKWDIREACPFALIYMVGLGAAGCC
jgi:hypothetical protein